MYVDWEYYKIFYYVAKYQNFTKAARVLGNNQPNITHSMNRLESQLNCVLFIRSNRGVTLTPEGELLYSRIASAAVQIQDAEEELSASATLEHGAISISATETALNIYLSEKLRAFHTEYPGIRLRISNHSTPQAVQAVKNGEVDFAIISTPAEVESGLKMVELKLFYEVLVGGKTFTALASQNLTLKELSNYPLISLSDESMTRSFYRQFFLEHDAVLKPDTEAATTDQMLTLVKSELGVNTVLSTVWADGGRGGEALAREVVRLCEEEKGSFTFAYDADMTIEQKIDAIVRRIYGGDGASIAPAAKKQIARLTELGFGNMPVCMAKTQYSFSDDQTKLGAPTGFTVTVRSVKVSAGAGFIVALTGDIMTMPGLPKVPAAERIDVDENGMISGLF